MIRLVLFFERVCLVVVLLNLLVRMSGFVKVLFNLVFSLVGICGVFMVEWLSKCIYIRFSEESCWINVIYCLLILGNLLVVLNML